MTIDVLTELYHKNQFQHGTDSCQIVENAENAIVTGAIFSLKGADFIVCANETIWNHGLELYTKDCPIHSFKFRKKCDGFVICTFKGQKYLIWIELKSSFNEVFDKAIYQLSGCYVKMKSYLNCFSDYHPEEYKELGIVVSLPEEPYQEEEGNMATIDRRNTLCEHYITPTDICRSDYRNTDTPNTFFLRGKDFGIKNTHLSGAIALDKLPVYYYETKEGSPTIDLAPILAMV